MTFKTTMLAGSAALALAIGATSAWAASTAGTGTASGTVIGSTGQLTQARALSFGNFAAGTGGTVTVDGSTFNNSGATAGGGVTLAGGSPNTGYFQFSGGIPSTAYTIVLPGSATLNNGGNTLIMDQFVARDQLGIDPTVPGAVLAGSGNIDFTVGATLNVVAGSPAGTYSGTYAVTLNN